MFKYNGFFAGLTLLVASGLMVLGLYRFTHFWMGVPDQPEKVTFYEVKKNAAPVSVIRDLKEQGIIQDQKLFYWYSRFTGKLSKFKAGDYRFNNRMKPDEILGILISGVSYGFLLTIPEGISAVQIASLVEKIRPGDGKRFLELVHDRDFIGSLNVLSFKPDSLEGFLYPNTYSVTRLEPMEELIRQMVRNYKQVFNEEYQKRARELGFTEYQALTLASIVERETGAPEERPMVASVFHNRLKKKMKLQSDPTVIYGLKNYDGNIHRKDLLAPHPYNTYVIPALPKGPIGNPGAAAMKATLYPAESNYLFFVSHNDGTHEFTTNLQDHEKAVQKFQVDPAAREGRSWKDLSKKLGTMKN